MSATIALGVAMSATPALAGDRALLSALDGGLAPTVSASRAAAGGTPNLVQAHYDRARDLQEKLAGAAPVSGSCTPLGGWASRYASAEVASAESFDRLDPAGARRWRSIANAARARLVTARRVCTPGPAQRAATAPTLVDPRPWAVTFGAVSARTPPGATAATLMAGSDTAGPLALGKGLASARLTGTAARYNLKVEFTKGEESIGVAESPHVWLLPSSADGSIREATLDAGLQARIRAEASRFSGKAGIWVQNLATGEAASWNAGARFPAASTVKLGVLVAALARMGPQPERSAIFHDVRALATWSSNLASNRLLTKIGGAGVVYSTLRRMGATSSTFTGPYRVATAVPDVDAPAPPPRVSARVTTAYDLATVMRTIHAAALGESTSVAATGMTRTQARLGLGLLLSSEAEGDNRGILRESAVTGEPIAQKHGWISSARHSAGIIYTSRGPVVVVVLTYAPGMTRSEAAALGNAVVRIATP
jgi:beta-lactamase class A